MTSLPAGVFGMGHRGQIKAGYWADMVMFDPVTIKDMATYDAPKTEAQGISLVIVNGSVAFQDGVNLNAGSGKMLRFRRSAYGE